MNVLQSAGFVCLLVLVNNARADRTEQAFNDILKSKLDGFSTGNKELDYMSKWVEIAQIIESNPSLREEWDHRVQLIEKRDIEYPFPPFECDIITSGTPPTSVHTLRPGDINVVAAMGDSITAGNGLGANGLVEVAYQNRGESWCVGGNEDLEQKVITIPNLLRKYNPDLKGFSRCRSGQAHYGYSWMNRAVPGGDSWDMPEQAMDVVARAKNDSRIDFENDWKMVTLWVGGNDLCGSCNNMDKFDAVPYREKIEEGLDILHRDLPRAIVNVIVMFDVSPLTQLSTGPLCDILHEQFCSCAVNNDTRPLLKQRQMAYYYELSRLCECSGKYDTRDDFTVVLQPMFRDMLPPIDPDTGEWDPSFLSYDCFHPARKSHQTFAHALWNTMFIKVGEKPFEFPYDLDTQYSCPTEENPFIYTNINSQSGWDPALTTTTTSTTTSTPPTTTTGSNTSGVTPFTSGPLTTTGSNTSGVTPLTSGPLTSLLAAGLISMLYTS